MAGVAGELENVAIGGGALSGWIAIGIGNGTVDWNVELWELEGELWEMTDGIGIVW